MRLLLWIYGGLPCIGRHFMEVIVFLSATARMRWPGPMAGRLRTDSVVSCGVDSWKCGTRTFPHRTRSRPVRDNESAMSGPRYMRVRLVESWKSRASSSSAVRTRQYDITRGGYIECGMRRGKSSSCTRPHRTWRGHYYTSSTVARCRSSRPQQRRSGSIRRRVSGRHKLR